MNYLKAKFYFQATVADKKGRYQVKSLHSCWPISVARWIWTSSLTNFLYYYMSKFQKRHVNQIWWNVITWHIKNVISQLSRRLHSPKLGWNTYANKQHDLTPRIYVLQKLKVAVKFWNRVKFMSYINWRFREEVLLRNATRNVHEEKRSCSVGGDLPGMNVFWIFFITTFLLYYFFFSFIY